METTISSAANSKLLADGYAAFARGDLETVSTLFRPDIVWHAQRLGTLSGDRQLDDRPVHRYRLVDGQVAEVWQYTGPAADDFWA